MNDWLNIPEGIDLKDYVGFVYLIINKTNNKKYIGKKLFSARRTLKPLKGKKRNRIIIKDSDWESYYGSCAELLADVKKLGKENFTREILALAKNKAELSYKELVEQVERRVLFRDDYYNGWISAKIYKNKRLLN